MEQLFQRVKAIILTPQTEWPVIAREQTEPANLFTGYVAILALIPALAGFIGTALIGRYIPIMSGLIYAIVSYLLAFVTVFVVALIVDALAPTFNSQKNFTSALKLTVYSYTPVWLAGIFMLIPGLSFLTILGVYGLYLMYLGLPPLMQTPKDKAILYAVTIVICGIVLQLVVGGILALIFFRVA